MWQGQLWYVRGSRSVLDRRPKITWHINGTICSPPNSCTYPNNRCPAQGEVRRWPCLRPDGKILAGSTRYCVSLPLALSCFGNCSHRLLADIPGQGSAATGCRVAFALSRNVPAARASSTAWSLALWPAGLRQDHACKPTPGSPLSCPTPFRPPHPPPPPSQKTRNPFSA